jgi:hypothetical protein
MVSSVPGSGVARDCANWHAQPAVPTMTSPAINPTDAVIGGSSSCKDKELG